jgi:hypothetical protein
MVQIEAPRILLGVMASEMIQERLPFSRGVCTEPGGAVPSSACDGAAFTECAYVLVGVDASEDPLV